MASWLGFGGNPVTISIALQGEQERKQVEQKSEKDVKELCPVYYDTESVAGQVSRGDNGKGRPEPTFSFGQTGHCATQGR